MSPELVTSQPAPVLTAEDLQQQLACSSRSIDRYRAAGMPHIVFGKRVLFDPIAVRNWIMSRQRRHDVPKVGRPRKHAA